MNNFTFGLLQVKSRNRLFLFSFFLMLLSAQLSWSQQVIVYFPFIDGGFESQIVGLCTSVSSIAGGSNSTIWSTSSASVATFQNTISRTGLVSVNFNPTSTTKRLQSPTQAAPAQQAAAATVYTIQYYYRTAGTTATAATMQVGLSAVGTGDGSYTTATVFNGTNGVWTKYSTPFTTKAGTSPNSPVGIIRSSSKVSLNSRAMCTNIYSRDTINDRATIKTS